ncbi:hypothetical protein KY285_010811 [Solanum tuberosum]|nr:hypothetical protein KY289_011384 [Solanum tuberosum]KAH0735104.1 hypothetical protein KY285_010811 [Solanum tuberosum]
MEKNEGVLVAALCCVGEENGWRRRAKWVRFGCSCRRQCRMVLAGRVLVTVSGGFGGHLFRRKEEKEALWRRGEAVRNGSGADVLSPEKGEK